MPGHLGLKIGECSKSCSFVCSCLLGFKFGVLLECTAQPRVVMLEALQDFFLRVLKILILISKLFSFVEISANKSKSHLKNIVLQSFITGSMQNFKDLSLFWLCNDQKYNETYAVPF